MGFFFAGGFVIIMFFLVFFLIFGIILFTIIRGFTQRNKNNHSPRLTVEAKVVAKRIDVTHHNHANAGDDEYGYYTTSHTRNFVTFQVESGDRIEFCMSGSEYGMLVEGDYGKLTFQGTRYLGFERI